MKNVQSIAAGALLLLLGAVACSGGGAGVTNSPAQSSPTLPAGSTLSRSTTTQDAVALTPAGSTTVIAINSGGGAAGSGWIGDTDYFNNQWSSTATVSNGIDTSHVTNPAPETVYQNQRYGAGFTYTIPNLKAYATYTVRLHFAETFFNNSGDRLFNVFVNGSEQLSNFDIFAAAGGKNIAVIKSLPATANGSGQIAIGFVATQNYVTLAGIQVLSGSVGTPAPSPTPTGSPGGDTMPWVYSELWSGSSPFKITVAAQKAAGATVVSHSSMDALWSQGIAGNGTAQSIPIYVASSSDPLLTAECTMYGGNCNAKNVQVHVPSYVIPQQSGDHHITIIDQNSPSGPIELDCWQASVSYGNIYCSWAGVYQLGGTGMTTDGSTGIHGGMAVSTVYTTAQEIVNGHIDHALGLTVACLNNPNVYPAWIASGTDTSCDGSYNAPHYGNLVHLLWSASQIAQSSYSAPCKVVLKALATYGAYLDDTGDNGMQIDTQNEFSYTANPATRGQDPWPGIQAQLNAAGDGVNSAWYSCLNRVASSDFEMLQVAQH